MADTDFDTNAPLGLPMQPTGSGIADLEILREQAALANGEAADDPTPTIATPDIDDSEIERR